MSYDIKALFNMMMSFNSKVFNMKMIADLVLIMVEVGGDGI